MNIPPVLKKTPVLVGAGVVVLIIILAARKSASNQSTSASGGYNYTAALAATQAANIQIAGINADLQKAAIAANAEVTLGSYSKDVSLANITAQTQVAAAKVASDENVSLTGLDYSHDIANRQLENNRILGLTQEDTKRLISTQTTQADMTVKLTALDVQRFLGQQSIASDEVKHMQDLALAEKEIATQERIADFTTSRALTWQQITGANQVAAIKANKPGFWQTLGGVLGGAANLAKVFV